MKLINKTQLFYLGFIIALLVLLSGVFLWAISIDLGMNVDNSIQSELQAFVKQAKSRNEIKPFHSQQIEVIKIKEVQDTTLSFSDTTIFDSVEQEPFDYRQVTTEAAINGQPYKITFRRASIESGDLYGTILIVELIFAILLIAGLFFINRTLLKRVWQPFHQIL